KKDRRVWDRLSGLVHNPPADGFGSPCRRIILTVTRALRRDSALNVDDRFTRSSSKRAGCADAKQKQKGDCRSAGFRHRKPRTESLKRYFSFSLSLAARSTTSVMSVTAP